MKKVILFYIAFALAAFAGLHLEKDPGYVLLALGQWTVEMPLWFFIVASVILLSLLHILLNFFQQIGSLKYRLTKFFSRYRHNTSRNKTKLGLIAFSEGQWLLAEKQLIKGIISSDSPLINYLTAAKAAQEQGKTKQRDKYLREAEKAMPETKIAILLTQAELQLASKQFEQAHATLNHLSTLVPKHPHVLKLMLSLYTQVEDWQELENLLPKLIRHKTIPMLQLEALEKSIFLNQLKTFGLKNNKGALLQAWSQMSKGLQKDPEVIDQYITELVTHNEEEYAEVVLKQALKKAWHEKLILSYGQLNKVNQAKQLKTAEGFIKQHPASANLYLALGIIAKKLQLWGKSKDYLEKSVSLQPKAETYFELGELYKLLNDDESASTRFEQGLNLVLKPKSLPAALPLR